jgi:hypothetical protein
MNDWSRLAVDLNEKQKLGAEKSNCTITNTLPRGVQGHVLSGSVS